jgi:hypothetical protein
MRRQCPALVPISIPNIIDELQKWNGALFFHVETGVNKLGKNCNLIVA